MYETNGPLERHFPLYDAISGHLRLFSDTMSVQMSGQISGQLSALPTSHTQHFHIAFNKLVDNIVKALLADNPRFNEARFRQRIQRGNSELSALRKGKV